ncbi:uncharacterized protein LOC131938905 [Physella acuta]|uniref:uncharacterized protein LOC131938905 n=1 Tax=Physella acuta TaxID=109671 RepID=UPI0027DB8624|nr:uncharacterized protein LOC131938905 [Physella acuta]
MLKEKQKVLLAKRKGPHITMRKITFTCVQNNFFSCSRIVYVVCLFLVLLLIAFTPLLRNTVLRPVWPDAWRELSTFDVIELRFFTANEMGVEPVTSCPMKTQPAVQLSEMDTRNVKSYNDVKASNLRSSDHFRFLPALSFKDKLRMLHTYLVLAEALRNMRVEFFFVDGSLLGVHRHQGIIPWDDDLDISVNVTDWKLVRHALSCIDGYILSVTTYMHWKFYPNSTDPRLGFPFVDIFFYTENENFIWAVSSSTSLYLVFAKADTFPLTTGQFEGLSVPIPKNTDKILKNRLDHGICQSSAMNHKTDFVLPWSSVLDVQCSSLSYLYTMYNLD